MTTPYKPKYTQQGFDQADLEAFVATNSFALVISVEDGSPIITPIPLIYSKKSPVPGAGEKPVLLGHFARNNPHWKFLKNKPVWVLFSGPHAYISPTWYNVDLSTTVPTWNYTQVEVASKKVRVFSERTPDDRAATAQIVQALVKKYEKKTVPDSLYDATKLDKEVYEEELSLIVGFEIEVESLDAKWKLSQKEPKETRMGVIKGLKCVHNEGSDKVAQIMEAKL